MLRATNTIVGQSSTFWNCSDSCSVLAASRMSSEPAANFFDVKPNAYMSSFGPTSGIDCIRSQKAGLPGPGDQVLSVSPKSPCTKTTATSR